MWMRTRVRRTDQLRTEDRPPFAAMHSPARLSVRDADNRADRRTVVRAVCCEEFLRQLLLGRRKVKER